VWVQLTYVLEQLTAPCPRERLAREHEHHVRAGVSQLRQRPQRLSRITQTLNPVVTTVALDELSLDLFKYARIFVDGD
jgi:hypothetical protein